MKLNGASTSGTGPVLAIKLITMLTVAEPVTPQPSVSMNEYVFVTLVSTVVARSVQPLHVPAGKLMV